MGAEGVKPEARPALYWCDFLPRRQTHLRHHRLRRFFNFASTHCLPASVLQQNIQSWA
jgi:hypothetical protein